MAALQLLWKMRTGHSPERRWTWGILAMAREEEMREGLGKYSSDNKTPGLAKH